MRSLADNYRGHFPALILGRKRDPVTQRWHFLWQELTPGAKDNYSIQPGARSGTADLHYALEENDRVVEAGAVVWLRHRDEDGGAVHYAFSHFSARAGFVVPDPTVPPSGGSGSLQGALCLSIADEGNCACLAGDYVLEYSAPLDAWIAAAEVCGLAYDFRYHQKDGGMGYEVILRVDDSIVGDTWYDADVLPLELHGVEVSGSACNGLIGVSLGQGPCGGCDEIIGGDGTLCFGEDLTILFKNSFAFGAVTSVCPVYSDLVGGDGIDVSQAPDGTITLSTTGGAGSGSARVLTGIVVQRQTLGLPVGLAVGAPECLESPQDCCASGGAPGCCFPRPPDVLWAWRLEASAGCACVLSCVELTYDAGRDAWYGGPIADVCGVTADVLLRLKCITGAYHLDCVLRGATAADDDLVGLSGSPNSSSTPSCDPFLSAWDFDDPEPVVCSAGGTFTYLIVESPCTPGSGAGGTIPTDCCPDDLLPETLYATFSGALSGIAPLALTYVTGGTLAATWRAFSAACGGTTFDFICGGVGGNWTLSALGATVVSMDGDPPAASCSPFLWSDSGVASGTCAGAFGVTITDSPP